MAAVVTSGLAAADAPRGLAELSPVQLAELGEFYPIRADAIGGSRVLIQLADAPRPVYVSAVAFVEVDLQTGGWLAYGPPASDFRVTGVENGRVIGLSDPCPLDSWSFGRVWVIDTQEQGVSLLFDTAEATPRWSKFGVDDASLSGDGSTAAVMLDEDWRKWEPRITRRTLWLIDLRDGERSIVRTERNSRREGHFQVEKTEFALAPDGSLLAVSPEQDFAIMSRNPGISYSFEALRSVVVERLTIGEEQLRPAATIEEAGYMFDGFRPSHSGTLLAVPAAFGVIAIADLTTGRVATTDDRLKTGRAYGFPGAWRPDSGTLLAVRTNPDEVVELSLDAEVLARWPTGRAARGVFWLPDEGPHALLADGEIVRLGDDGAIETVWVMPDLEK
ncbi:MAG: hypothetical protein EA423_09295 [Phycisphaerales bacterium]|nr:MAG: hypothetical protein EA423_09295 [Phycisphaerales bacterium]